jgi:hypothetical protein
VHANRPSIGNGVGPMQLIDFLGRGV